VGERRLFLFGEFGEGVGLLLEMLLGKGEKFR
jgi:hypothetical protein